MCTHKGVGHDAKYNPIGGRQTLVAKVRQYAKEHNTTLNQLIRDYIQEIGAKAERESFIDELLRLCEEHISYPGAGLEIQPRGTLPPGKME